MNTSNTQTETESQTPSTAEKVLVATGLRDPQPGRRYEEYKLDLPRRKRFAIIAAGLAITAAALIGANARFDNDRVFHTPEVPTTPVGADDYPTQQPDAIQAEHPEELED